MYMYSMSPFPLLFYCFSLSLYCVESFTHLFFFPAYISFLSLSLSLSLPSLSDMLKRVDLLCKELKDLETKAEDTRLKGEEIT